jgi:adenosylcobinamide kinase/adenosylcobinamide-phosphate guanylyltransferase
VRDYPSDIILVSNEVGLGIVPDNPLARKFRDLSGMLNQKLVDVCDSAIFMIAGTPIRIK